MEAFFHTTVVILTILYTLLVIAYARIFTRGPEGLGRFVRSLLVGTVSLQFLSILVRSVKVGACPLGSQPEFMALVAFSIAVTYLILELRIGERSTGVFAITPAFVLQVIATVGILGVEGPSSQKLGMLDSLHTFVVIVGLSAVALSSVYGILYLFLYWAIKRGHFGLFYQKMPSLETLSDLNFVVMCVAFLAITVASGLGFLVYPDAKEGAGFFLRPEVILTFVLWLLYGGCIFARRFFSFGGKRLAYTTVVGLVVLVGILLSLAQGFH